MIIKVAELLNILVRFEQSAVTIVSFIIVLFVVHTKLEQFVIEAESEDHI